MADRADTKASYDALAGIYLPVGIAVVAIVFAALGFAVWRYRDRGHHPAPSTRTGNLRVEVPFAMVLTLVAAGLITLSLSSISEEQSLADDPALEIEVTAFQWGWRFDYPGGRSEVGDQLDPPQLTVPTGVPVRFSMTSRDVIHSFWIPGLRFKRDAFPQRTTRFDLLFENDGFGQCAEFCGLEHANMDFEVRAYEPVVFESWLEAGAER